MSNSKMAGSNLVEVVPQTGKCPLNCNQCWHNRFPNTERIIPAPFDDKIYRINSRHDSNVNKRMVIGVASHYRRKFFNTSIANFGFPGPVVFTANPKEEEPVEPVDFPSNVMGVRLRVSKTNLDHVARAVGWITAQDVPVVLTFMSYYTTKPDLNYYDWKIRHDNEYYVPKKAFIDLVLARYVQNRLVHACKDYCKDCRLCETLYRLWESKQWN